MNILTVSDLPDIQNLLNKASYIKQDRRGWKWDTMHGLKMGTLFLEPSTRTRWSFEAAMYNSGGNVISSESGLSTSITKEESLYDTIKVVSNYVDVLVVRSEFKLDKDIDAECPVINAGDGKNEHPTQALLDVFTIEERLHKTENLTIGVCGDLIFSRTIHSFVNLLRGKNSIYLYDTVRESRIYYNGEWPFDVTEDGTCNVLSLKEMEDKFPSLDVLYLNRTQTERHRGCYIATAIPFILNENHLKNMKDNCVILNPGPRGRELPSKFDNDPRVAFFDQVRNGVYTRMALLDFIM